MYFMRIRIAIDSLKSGVSFEASSLSFSEQLRLVNSSYNDWNQDNLSELLAPEMIFLTELLLPPEAMTALSAKSSSKAEIMQIDQTQVSTDTITGLDKNQSAILAAILESTASNLGDFADSSEFIDYINLIANFSWNQGETRTLLQKIAKFENLPDIRIIPFNHLKAKGAFGNDTIYLSQEFFESNIDSPQKIVDVVSEELGHYLDSKLIEEDSPGNEGAIFASLLKKESLSTAELLDLKTENDHATLHAEGQRVLADLDLLAETSGEINQPFVFQVPDSISPDTFGATDAIDLDFQTSVDNAKISEIVVRSTNKKPSKNPSIPSRRVSSDWESELIQILNYDMKGPHEGKPSGVPSSYDWANGPIVDKSRDVSKYEAYTAWGQVYSDAAGNPATNTRVQIKDVQTYMLSKQDGKWHLLQSSIDVDGAAYREDFSGDVNIPADIREEPDGSISVQLSEGYNYHFWPSTGRTPINPENIAGLVMTVKARLITDNPQQPDDRSEARYLLGMGGDYWTTMTAQWDNWTTNGGVGVGKLKYVTLDWQYFTMHTLSPEEIRQNPPPLEASTSSSSQ